MKYPRRRLAPVLLLALASALPACGIAAPGDAGDEASASDSGDAPTTDDTPDVPAPLDVQEPDASTEDVPEADSADGGTNPDVFAFAPPAVPASDVRQGDRGLAVGQLQFLLKLATGRRLDEDGAFGPATLALLQAFQTSVGLPTSMVADAATRAALGPAAARAARALERTYGTLPAALAVPSSADLARNLGDSPVVPGEGDRTGTYMGRVGFSWGDGAESTSITQGSPAHIDWVAGRDLSPSEVRVIGVISRNEGPFDAVNSYDAGDYTWGAYQLIGSYRAQTYNPGDDELSRGLAYAKILDPASFWYAFQRHGVDVAFEQTATGTVRASSVMITLTRPDGTVLRGREVWVAVGTEAQLNQVFINAGRDPRIQRTEILGAQATHFDALGLPLDASHAVANAYLSSERAVACFLDMELNIGRSGARRAYVAAIDSVASDRGLNAAMPGTWPAGDRAMIEAEVLQHVLANAPSSRYATRMQRVLSSSFIDDAVGSFVPR